jgi:hypothetical protein
VLNLDQKGGAGVLRGFARSLVGAMECMQAGGEGGGGSRGLREVRYVALSIALCR